MCLAARMPRQLRSSWTRTPRTTRCRAPTPVNLETADVDVRYTPGARFVAVSGSAVAVLDPAVTDEVLEAVWRALVAGGGVGEVLQIMTGAYGTSLTSIPP